MKTPQPYVTLWVTVSDLVTREPYKDDDWDRGDSAESLENYGVDLSDPNLPQKHKSANMYGHYSSRDRCMNAKQLGFMPKVGDKVYLVIEIFSSGDTFGNTDPQFRPAKVFKTAKSANKWLASEEAENFKDIDYFGGHKSYEIYSTIVT